MIDGTQPRGRDFFQALYEISTALTSLNLERVLNHAMDRVVELMHAERGFIMLTDEQGAMKCAVARNIDNATISDPRQISHQVLDQVIGELQPVLTMNAMEDFPASESVIAYGLRSLACAPLIAHGQLIGVVYVDNRLQTGTIRPPDLELLVAFASIAASAIDNARLYEDLKRINEEQLRLRDELHQQELLRAGAERVSEFKSQMINFISHEVMQPLTNIKLYVETLRSDRDGMRFPLERRQEYYDNMAAQCTRLQNTCIDLLESARIEGGHDLRLRPKPLDLAALLAAAVRTQQHLIGDSHELVLEPTSAPCMIVADEVKMAQVVYNLLSNAYKYSPDGGRIAVRLTDLGDRVRVAISDAGIGMTPEQMNRLFQQYERPAAEETPWIGGHGLGLFLVKRIIDAHRGTITVKSAPGHGSTFTFELPRNDP